MEFKKDYIFSETSYYRVIAVDSKGIKVQIDGTEITPTIGKEYAEKFFRAADAPTRTEKKNKTELAEIFLANPNTAFTVCWNKQLKPEDVLAKLDTLYPNTGGKLLAKEAWLKQVKSVAKDLTKGQEETARGYHEGKLSDAGRVYITDMDKVQDPAKSYSTRVSQVDTRSILWLIIDGTKYELK